MSTALSAWTRCSPRPRFTARTARRTSPLTANCCWAYKESVTGQLLHEGISEAGATSSAIAVGSAYATHGEPMIPVYLFYSMFGFQRTADSIWAMADQMARGFLIGATAGRTTLTGEGLQHADGQSPLIAQTNPAIVHYDPAFGFEISHPCRRRLAPHVRHLGGAPPR
jgi:pyruvate dehydrogenase E1 component